ncbi:MAG: AAA family ATPase [Bacillota bacterium]
MKLIIITGPLASLKSTITHRLAVDLDGVWLSKDYLKEAMAIDNHPTNQKDNITMSHAAVNIMISVVKHNIHQHSTWILDANFKAQEYDMFVMYLNAHYMPFVSVYLYANTDTLYSRYLNREPERHPIHQSKKPMSYDTFKVSVNYYHTHFFNRVTVAFDTTTFNDSAYERLKHMIKTHL